MAAAEEHSILTLAPEEISRFLMRTRRDRDLERFEVRLDEHLREVLARADDFVPSQAGAILLDDPRAKLQGKDVGRLTVIACFGEGFQLGTRVPADQGGVGTIYQRGQPLKLDDIIGVPVVLGESVCGVLELRGRRIDPHRAPTTTPTSGCATRRATSSCCASSPPTSRRRSRTRSTPSARASWRGATI